MLEGSKIRSPPRVRFFPLKSRVPIAELSDMVSISVTEPSPPRVTVPWFVRVAVVSVAPEPVVSTVPEKSVNIELLVRLVDAAVFSVP